MDFLMKCGCAAASVLTRDKGVKVDPPIPYCGIHKCYEQMPAPDLDGRMARCLCLTTRPSSPDLAFFQFRGPGSREATETCECGFYRVAHEIPERAERLKCKTFRPRGPHEFDSFYCGCWGWD